MQHESPATVIKVWLYAAVSVAAGAWVTPLLYNAGKALAEVSSKKTTNGFLEWLAKWCGVAELPAFFVVGVLLVAAVLFFPWMEWIHARSASRGSSMGPWLLRLPNARRLTSRGQPLRRNLGGLWDSCAGFMLVAGLMLSMGVALVPAGYFTLKLPPEGMLILCLRTFWPALAIALVMEVFFRGVAMGIFMRAMRPAAALGMSAAFFALVLAMFPPPGLNVADPDAPRTGFELLGLVIGSYADWRNLFGTILPLLALGGVLAYARWRTASLWLPTGLHTGWIFALDLLGRLSVPQGAGESLKSGSLLQEGLIPLIAILLAGLLAHRITPTLDDERALHTS